MFHAMFHATPAPSWPPEPLRQLAAEGFELLGGGGPLGHRRAEGLSLLGDLLIYWGHRLQHHSALLWRFHAVHHSAEHLDWLAAHREHPPAGRHELAVPLGGALHGVGDATLPRGP